MKLKFNLILLLITFLFSFQKSHSITLENIIITGNQRISDTTIVSFLPIKIKDQITDKKINLITKDLYESNFFKNVTVKTENNIIFIDVIENPIIQRITYKGIKSDQLLNKIIEGASLIERSSFVENILKEHVEQISKNLKISGYYFSEIKTSIENLEDNMVNLFFDIKLGDKAKIDKIIFLGNKIFKDKKLKSIVLSEEYKFWKLLSGRKFLNEELVEFDKRLLKNFFLNNGYYNVKISSTFAKSTIDGKFELIYNIDAGEKIFFGNLNLDLPLNFDKENFSKVTKTLKGLEGQNYSLNSIEKITDAIDIIALNDQYETIDIEVIESIDNNQLNLKFKILEAPKTLVKKINILGNNITRENVIRNQFEIDEGDFFNDLLLKKSINNLKSLNFFKTVTSEVLQDDLSEDKIININIKEKPTGEIGAAAGIGTTGNSVGFFVKENNYLGKGLGVSANLSLDTDSIKGSFLIENPNFNDTNKSVYSRFDAIETDKLKDFGYKTNKIGFGFGTDFEILEDLNLGLGNSNYYEKIETDSSASALQKKQTGNYWDSYLDINFTYDKRNQKFQTTDGFLSRYSLDLPIVSDTNTLSNIYEYSYFTELFEDNRTTFSFYAKSSFSLSNDDIKLTERNFLPSKRLRGFESGKVGPKDGGDFIGGNYVSSFNINSTIPQILESNQNIDFIAFLDAANVWGVDYSSSLNDSNKIRSSIGVGVDWLTTIGPLNFSLALPISKIDSDVTETFRFNLGTTF
jgi:outer membrane protein insertion porin family